MPIRKFKPTSPGRRFMSVSGFDEVTTDEPEKTLLESLPTHAGRNNQGRITVRHQGGGYRKLYRKIDFKRDKHGISGNGATIHNIELTLGRGGQLVRSAGASAQLLAKEGDYAVVRMPSGELRRIHVRCQATIGQVGNIEHENESGGKAGRSRWLGVRPTVRGSTMNPRDHPHGGGEGKTGPGGNPKTPWGKPALGYRTRKPKKASDKLIIRRREKKGRSK